VPNAFEDRSLLKNGSIYRLKNENFFVYKNMFLKGKKKIPAKNKN